MSMTVVRTTNGAFPVHGVLNVGPKVIGERVKPRPVESLIPRSSVLTAFAHRRPITIPDSTRGGDWTACGTISSLMHEDGSGYSFLITMHEYAGKTFYVRTI